MESGAGIDCSDGTLFFGMHIRLPVPSAAVETVSKPMWPSATPLADI